MVAMVRVVEPAKILWTESLFAPLGSAVKQSLDSAAAASTPPALLNSCNA
jgi:hypothetical protein